MAAGGRRFVAVLLPVTVALGTLAPGARAGAETILLSDGQTLVVEQAWIESGELRYRRERNGAVHAIPLHLVARVEGPAGGPALVDPDAQRSRERLAAGDPAEALRHARLALFRQPRSISALQALAAAQLALGDAKRAAESAEAALSVEPKDPASHELLGDALTELADFVGAREHYRMALELAPGSTAARKLESLQGSAAASGARFQLRYDGAADEPLGLAVLRVLDAAWADHEKRLGFAPQQPVTVVLQTATGFRDTTRAPEWVAAWNDGTIRVPVMGLDAPTAELVRVLRHELAHSFVASRGGASVPTWLHEGIAQWLEGRDPSADAPALARLAQSGTLRRLEALENPFLTLSEAQAAEAYAQCLSVVGHVLRLRGPAGLRRIIDALADGHPAAEALPVAIGMSYGELQRDWERFLRAEVRGAGL